MTYKILGDSCMDLTEELKQDPHFHMVPLTLQVIMRISETTKPLTRSVFWSW